MTNEGKIKNKTMESKLIIDFITTQISNLIKIKNYKNLLLECLLFKKII